MFHPLFLWSPPPRPRHLFTFLFLFSFIRLLAALSPSGSPHKPAQLPPARSPAPRHRRDPPGLGTRSGGSGRVPGAQDPFPGLGPQPSPAALAETRTRPRVCNYLLAVFAISGAGASGGPGPGSGVRRGQSPTGRGRSGAGRPGRLCPRQRSGTAGQGGS